MSIELLVKRALKACVRGARLVLPERLFDWLYARTFPIYRAVIRLLYYCRGLLLYSWWHRSRWRMIREVHAILPYSLVGIKGLHATYRLAEEMMAQPRGDFVELGVARGGCAALLGNVLFRESCQAQRRLHLFDSFQGLPEPGEQDYVGGSTGDHVRPLPAGSCLGTLDEVKHLLLEVHGLPEAQVVFHQGWFHETVPAAAAAISEIAVLRIDGDWYESTRICLQGLYDKVIPGGAVIIDDYQSCYGCRKAVDEFIAENRLEVQLVMDGRGGCYFYKR
jgi:hypothetical protein